MQQDTEANSSLQHLLNKYNVLTNPTNITTDSTNHIIETPTPLFVLRSHTCEVSSLEITTLPLSLFFVSPEHYAAYFHHHTNIDNYTSNILHPTIKVLISGDSTGRVIIWDLSLQKILVDFIAHTDVVLHLQVLGNGRILCTQGKEGCVKTWDIYRLMLLQYNAIQHDVNILDYIRNVYEKHPFLFSHKTPKITQSNSFIQDNSGDDREYYDEDFEIDEIVLSSSESDDDTNDYSYMLQKTQYYQKQQKNLVNQSIMTAEVMKEHNAQQLTHQQAIFYRNITLLDLFHINTKHTQFSFDAAIPARLCVLITNSYTFSKMKLIFIESQLMNTNDIERVEDKINEKFDKLYKNYKTNNDFIQFGHKDFNFNTEGGTDNDSDQVASFLSKYGDSSKYGNSSINNSENPPNFSPLQSESQESQSNPTITTTSLQQTQQLDNNILDLAYLLLSPCENGSALKVWRIIFSLNIYTPLSSTHPFSYIDNYNDFTNLTTTNTNTNQFFYNDIDFFPYHIQTLVIDKSDDIDEVSNDSSLNELRRLHQFKSIKTIDEHLSDDSIIRHHGDDDDNDDILMNNDILTEQQMLIKSGIIMHIAVKQVDLVQATIQLLSTSPQSSITQGGGAYSTLKQYQIIQLVNLIQYLAQNNKQVLIVALSNLFQQILYTEQHGRYNHNSSVHNWLDITMGTSYEIVSTMIDDQEGSDIDIDIDQQSSQFPQRHQPYDVNKNTSDALLQRLQESDDDIEVIDKVVKSNIIITEKSSGLAKMLLTRQIDEKQLKSQKITKNDLIQKDKDYYTIKNKNVEIYYLFSTFINFLLTQKSAQSQDTTTSPQPPQNPLFHDFLLLLFLYQECSKMDKSYLKANEQQFLFLLSIVTEGGHLLLYQLNLHKMFIFKQQFNSKTDHITAESESLILSELQLKLSNIFHQYFHQYLLKDEKNELLQKYASNPSQHQQLMDIFLSIFRNYNFSLELVIKTFKLMMLYLTTSIYSTKTEYTSWLQLYYQQLKHKRYGTKAAPNQLKGGIALTSNFIKQQQLLYTNQHDYDFISLCQRYTKLPPKQQKLILSTLPPSMVLLLNRYKPSNFNYNIIYDQRVIVYAPDHPKYIRLNKNAQRVTRATPSSETTMDKKKSSYLENSPVNFNLPSLLLIRLLSLADGTFSDFIHDDDKCDPAVQKAEDKKKLAQITHYDEISDIPAFISPTGLLLYRLQLCYYYLNPPSLDNLGKKNSQKSQSPFNKQSGLDDLDNGLNDDSPYTKLPLLQRRKYFCLNNRLIVSSKGSNHPKKIESSTNYNDLFLNPSLLLLNNYNPFNQNKRSNSDYNMINSQQQQQLSSLYLLYHQRIVKDSLLSSCLGNELILLPSLVTVNNQSQTSWRKNLLLLPLLSFRIVLGSNHKYVKSLTFHAQIYPNTIIIPDHFYNKNISSRAQNTFISIQPILSAVKVIAQTTNQPQRCYKETNSSLDPNQHHFLSLLFKQSYEIAHRLLHLHYTTLKNKRKQQKSTKIIDDDVINNLAELDSSTDNVDIESHSTPQAQANTLLQSQHFTMLLYLLTYIRPHTLTQQKAETQNLNQDDDVLLKNTKIILKNGYKVDTVNCLSLMVMQVLSTIKLNPKFIGMDTFNDETVSSPKQVDLFKVIDDDENDDIVDKGGKYTDQHLIWTFDEHQRSKNAKNPTQLTEDEKLINNTEIIKGGYSVLSYTSCQPLVTSISLNNQSTTGDKTTYHCLFYGSKHIVTCGWDHRIRLLSSDIDLDITLLLSSLWYSLLHQYIISLFSASATVESADTSGDYYTTAQQSVIVNWLQHHEEQTVHTLANRITTFPADPAINQNKNDTFEIINHPLFEDDEENGKKGKQFHKNEHFQPIQSDGFNISDILTQPTSQPSDPYAPGVHSKTGINTALLMKIIKHTNLDETLSNIFKVLPTLLQIVEVLHNHSMTKYSAQNYVSTADIELLDEPSDDDLNDDNEVIDETPNLTPTSELYQLQRKKRTAQLDRIINPDKQKMKQVDRLIKKELLKLKEKIQQKVDPLNIDTDGNHHYVQFKKAMQTIYHHYLSLMSYVEYMPSYEVHLLWNKLGIEKISSMDTFGSQQSFLNIFSIVDENNLKVGMDDLDTNVTSYYRSEIVHYLKRCCKNHITAIKASIIMSYQNYVEFLTNYEQIQQQSEQASMMGGMGGDPMQAMMQQLMQSKSVGEDKIKNKDNALMVKINTKLAALQRDDPVAVSNLHKRLAAGEDIRKIARELMVLGYNSEDDDDEVDDDKEQEKMQQNVHMMLLRVLEMVLPQQYNLTGILCNIIHKGDHLIHYIMHTYKSLNDATTNGSAFDFQSLQPQLLDMDNNHNDTLVVPNKMAVILFLHDVIRTHIVPIQKSNIPAQQQQQQAGPGPAGGASGMLNNLKNMSIPNELKQQLQGISGGDNQSLLMGNSDDIDKLLPNRSNNSRLENDAQLSYDVESLSRHIKLSYIVQHQQSVVGFLNRQQTILTKQTQQFQEWYAEQDRMNPSALSARELKQHNIIPIKYRKNTYLQRLLMFQKYSYLIFYDNYHEDINKASVFTAFNNASAHINQFKQLLVIPNKSISINYLKYNGMANLTHRIDKHDHDEEEEEDEYASTDGINVTPELVHQSLYELLLFFLQSYDIHNILTLSQEQRQHEITRYDNYVKQYYGSKTANTANMATKSSKVKRASLQENYIKVLNLCYTHSFIDIQQQVANKQEEMNNVLHEYSNRLLRPGVTDIHEYQYKTMIMTLYMSINKIQEHQQQQHDDVDSPIMTQFPLSVSEIRDILNILFTVGCFCCYYIDINLLTHHIIHLSHSINSNITPTTATTPSSISSSTHTHSKRALPSNTNRNIHTKGYRHISDEKKSVTNVEGDDTDNEDLHADFDTKQLYYINNKRKMKYMLHKRQKKENEEIYAKMIELRRLEKEKEQLRKKEQRRLLKEKDNPSSSVYTSSSGMIIEIISSSDEDNSDDDVNLTATTPSIITSSDVSDDPLNLILCYEPEYNTELDIIELIHRSNNASFAPNSAPETAYSSSESTNYVISDHLVSNPNTNILTLLKHPVYTFSLLLHSIEQPLQQQLLILFHKGQVSALAINNQYHTHTNPHDVLLENKPQKTSPHFELVEHDATPTEQQHHVLKTHINPGLFPVVQSSRRDEKGKQGPLIIHQLPQQIIGAAPMMQQVEPEMATAGTDGVIALWKKYF